MRSNSQLTKPIATQLVLKIEHGAVAICRNSRSRRFVHVAKLCVCWLMIWRVEYPKYIHESRSPDEKPASTNSKGGPFCCPRQSQIKIKLSMYQVSDYSRSV